MKKLIPFLIAFNFSTFAHSHLDFNLSDFCIEQPNVQYRGGIYYFPNEEVGITATSICVHKDAYGQYESKGELNDGKFDGKRTFWCADGKKKNEINYVNGIAEGKEDGKRPTSWYENGQIKTEGTFEDGVLILETIR